MTLEETEACSPFSLMAPSVDGAENHVWTFGDGTGSSSVPNPVHVFENSTDSCHLHLDVGRDQQLWLSWFCLPRRHGQPEPCGRIHSGHSKRMCSPLTVTFEELSQRATSFAWNYGDATTADGHNATTHAHTFDLEGFEPLARAVTLTVEAEGGCTDSHTVAVEVYPEVVSRAHEWPSKDVPLGRPTCGERL